MSKMSWQEAGRHEYSEFKKPFIPLQTVFLSRMFPFSHRPGTGNNMDATSSLERFAQQVLRYCVNLDGFVDQHEARVLYGGQVRVYEGTFRPEGRKVAVKTIRFCPPESDAIIEVHPLCLCGSH